MEGWCELFQPAHTSAMKYFASVHAAYDVTGEERYRDEAVKCVRQLISKGLIPSGQQGIRARRRQLPLLLLPERVLEQNQLGQRGPKRPTGLATLG